MGKIEGFLKCEVCVCNTLQFKIITCIQAHPIYFQFQGWIFQHVIALKIILDRFRAIHPLIGIHVCLCVCVCCCVSLKVC
ncbi:hypothetical protein Peur_041597 [Populus x canadensis]